MSASASNSALADIRLTLVKVAAGFVVIVGLSWALGEVFNPAVMVFMFVALAALALTVTRVGEFSVSFALSAVGMTALVLALAEGVLPVAETLGVFGIDISGLNLWVLAVGSFVATALVVVADIRIFSAFRHSSGRPTAVNPDKVAKAFQRQITRILDKWRGVFVALLFLGFVVAQMLFGIVGDVGGLVANEIAKVPVVSGFAAFIPIVYTNMGGNVPWLTGLPFFGTLTAGEVLGVGIALLLTAYFVRRGRED